MNHPTYHISSGSAIRTIDTHTMLNVASWCGVTDATVDAPGASLCRGRIESHVKLHIRSPMLIWDTLDLWEKIKDALPYLDLDCAWVEYGTYKGCVYQLRDNDD